MKYSFISRGRRNGTETPGYRDLASSFADPVILIIILITKISIRTYSGKCIFNFHKNPEMKPNFLFLCNWDNFFSVWIFNFFWLELFCLSLLSNSGSGAE